MTSPVKPSEAEKALTHPDMAEAAPEPGAAAAVGALSDEHLARKAGACARPLGGMWGGGGTPPRVPPSLFGKPCRGGGRFLVWQARTLLVTAAAAAMISAMMSTSTVVTDSRRSGGCAFWWVARRRPVAAYCTTTSSTCQVRKVPSYGRCEFE